MPVAIRQDALADSELGPGRQEILRVLRAYPGYALTLKEIQEKLPAMKYNNLRLTIRRMLEDGQVAKYARGAYYVENK